MLDDGTDPAHWENIRKLPSPPEFTIDLPTPSARALYFLKDGHLIATYLDHGILYVVSRALRKNQPDRSTVAGMCLQ